MKMNISAKSTLLSSKLVPLGSFKVCSDAKERVACRKKRDATAPITSLVKLQPWFLSLWWKTCLRQNCSLGSCACSEGPALGQNTLIYIYIYIYISSLCLCQYWNLPQLASRITYIELCTGAMSLAHSTS